MRWRPNSRSKVRPSNRRRRIEDKYLVQELNQVSLVGYTVITTLLAHEPREHLTNNGIHVFTADVTKDEDIKNLRDEVEAITPSGLDVLVNCA
jgi:NAD(P)-dependent dehydrogenase (short-subunit alcohol dehydrogenase family)